MSDKTDYHNKGEQDYAEGKSYEAPHSRMGLTGTVFDADDDEKEDRDAYREGWNNAKKQD